MSAIGAQVVEYFYKFSIFKIIVGNIYMEGNDQPLRQSKNFLCMPRGKESIRLTNIRIQCNENVGKEEA